MLSFTIPRTAHLASQVLPAAGAYTSQNFATLPAGTRELIYWITYTRGGAGGYPIFDVQWGDGVDEASELVLDEASFVAAPPSGNANVYMQKLLGPAPADGNPVGYLLALIVPYGATQARLRVAEGGAVGTPGTVIVSYTGGTGAP